MMIRKAVIWCAYLFISVVCFIPVLSHAEPWKLGDSDIHEFAISEGDGYLQLYGLAAGATLRLSKHAGSAWSADVITETPDSARRVLCDGVITAVNNRFECVVVVAPMPQILMVSKSEDDSCGGPAGGGPAFSRCVAISLTPVWVSEQGGGDGGLGKGGN
jgi:hypothetical protein